jgi:hypothetical protein
MTTITAGLPIATSNSLGGVIPDGSTITIDNNGVISAASTGAFVSPVLTGTTTVQHLTEIITPINGATGTVTHNLDSGSSVFYHTNVADNFTANFTGLPTTDGRSYLITLIVAQGNTAFIPHAVSIDNVSQTIYWNNNTQPTGTANKKEFFTFTLLRAAGSWIVTADLSSFG